MKKHAFQALANCQWQCVTEGKNMKKLLLTSLFALACLHLEVSAATMSQEQNHIKSTTPAAPLKQPVEEADKNTVIIPCQVHFEFAKTDFDQPALAKCIANIQNKEALKYIQIITSATPVGSHQYNNNLTDQRVERLHAYLKKEFPNSQIRFTAIGKNARYGRTGMINFVLAKNLMAHKIEESSDGSSSNTGNKLPFHTRIALRFGRDLYMVSSQAAYFSLGAEASLQFKESDIFQYEVGLQGAQLVNDSYLTLYNFYAFGWLIVKKSF